MEIILQVLACIMELFGELFLQLILEIIAELIGHRFRKDMPSRKPVSPWLATIGYLIAGALAGWLSLLLAPDLFIKSYWLRLLNLFLTPLASGFVMAQIGSWRRRNDREAIRLETFAYGFCFAFAMSMVRFVWGRAAL